MFAFIPLGDECDQSVLLQTPGGVNDESDGLQLVSSSWRTAYTSNHPAQCPVTALCRDAEVNGQ